jgi:hypothetical protein
MCLSRKWIPLMAAAAAIVPLYEARSQSAVQLIDGGIILRVDDQTTTRCVNGSSDVVTFHLVRMVSETRSDWLNKDQSVGLLIDTTIEGATAASSEKISFPRSFMMDVKEYRPGIVYLPVEQKLLSRFRLKQDSNTFTSMQFDFKLVSTRTGGPLVQAVRLLSEITNDLPLPANPFVEGFKFFAHYGTKVISRMQSLEAGGASAHDVQARLTFEFSADGNCTGQMETTGAKLIVRQFSGDEKHGFIDVSRANEYCWRFFQNPLREVRFARRVSGACPSDAAGFTNLSNPHYFGILNAVSLGAQRSPVKRIIKASDLLFPSSGVSAPSGASPSPNELHTLVASWTGSGVTTAVSTDQLVNAAQNYNRIEKEYLATPQTALPASLERLGYTKIDTAEATSRKVGAAWTITNSLRPVFFEQAVPQFEAAAADMAATLQRCKNFGIGASDCL